MQSKTSFFNKSIFTKTVMRLWPIWAILSICVCMIPVALLIDYSSGNSKSVNGTIYMYYDSLTSYAPWYSFLLAIVVAMAVWNYLYSAKSVGMFHALPISRPALFVSNYLAGLVVMLIPYVIAGIFTVIVTECAGVGAMAEAVELAGAIVAETILFFSFATLIAHLVSNVLALPVLYVLFMFLENIFESLLNEIMSRYCFGVVSMNYDNPSIFSPMTYICNQVGYDVVYPEDPLPGIYELKDATITLNNYSVVWWYALAGVALTVIALLLYKNRKSETAGDVVAFKPVKTVLHIICTVIAAVAGGFIFYDLLCGYNYRPIMNPVGFSVSMIIAGFIGFYGILMLLNRTVRVFSKKSFVGVGIISALYIVLNVLCANDAFNMEGYVPDVAEIEHLDFYTEAFSLSLDSEDTEVLNIMVDMHKDVIENKETLLAENTIEMGSINLTYEYTLKDGKKVRRYYWGTIDPQNYDAPGTYEYLFKEKLNSEAVMDKVLSENEGMRLDDAMINVSTEETSIYETLYGSDADGLYEALLKDIEAGAVTPFDMSASNEWYYTMRVEFYMETEHNTLRDAYYSNWFAVTLKPEMENTLAFLEEAGIFSKEMLEKVRNEDHLWKGDTVIYY